VKPWSGAAQLLIVGFYVPLSLLIPTAIGFWLDRRAGHGFPSGTLIGLGIGTLIMVYGVYRMVQPFLEEARGETEKRDALSGLRKTMIGRTKHHNREKER
jgi:hypothetical protein